MLSQRELIRYDRQIPLIGIDGQEKLKDSTILVVGVGGLGSAASYYLVAAGVGKIILIDNGVLEESNLQRQILYTIDDIGKPKVYVASRRLKKLNPYIEIVPLNKELTEDLLQGLIDEVDVVVDGLDNWEGRMIIDKVCYRSNKPFVHAGVYGFYGQLTVIIPGKTPCLKCIFPKNPHKDGKPIPVFPTTPGILGILEANEALKIVLGKGNILANKLLIYDGLLSLFEIVDIDVSPNCTVCREYLG